MKTTIYDFYIARKWRFTYLIQIKVCAWIFPQNDPINSMCPSCAQIINVRHS